jgi:hypothetical protein
VPFAAVAVVTACQWIAGINDRQLYDGGTTSDGGDAGVSACSMPNVPPNPGSGTSSPTDSVSFTAALSSIALGSTDGGPYYGFNLDSTCTCEGMPVGVDSCQRQPNQDAACDDPAGVDNYARRIFEQINALNPDGGFITESKLNSALQSGLSGALISVSSYNGKADDGEVTVTVSASLGVVGYPTPPKFDGTDQWYLDSTTPSSTTYNAYVAGYTLVAPMSFPIVVGSTLTQPVHIQLNDGTLRADIQMGDGGGFAKLANGLIGGRWDPAVFLPSLAVVPDPMGSGYLCPGTSITYVFLKNIICQNTDINASQSNDFAGLCDAVSMGLGFEALPSNTGPPKAPPDSGSPCIGNTDHCM